MKVEELLAQSRDALTVKRVFGEPIERDGVTVVPVASVSALLGGGQGGGGEGAGYGEGGGYGFLVRARPAGAYIIKDDEVSWEPAINVNAIVAGAEPAIVATPCAFLPAARLGQAHSLIK